MPFPLTINEAGAIVVKSSDYEAFKTAFFAKKYPSQRLGQAFWNEFDIHKLNEDKRLILNRLYQLNGNEALSFIETHILIDYE